MKTTTPANLKGMAKHTHNRVMSAMAEDTTTAMLHAFATLTDGAKAIALQSGKFSSLYIRGERKGMVAEEAAKELAERAAGCVTRKLRKIDMVCAASFLAEYISRQRKAEETPETPNPDNTPTTMNTTEAATMYTDYKTAVHWCNNALIMCNNIPQIDPTVIDNARFAWYDEETETDTEVFQWFITDCSQLDVEYLEEHFPGLLFTYSDLLDCFILCVDHFGTAWGSVRIETTLPNAARENI